MTTFLGGSSLLSGFHTLACLGWCKVFFRSLRLLELFVRHGCEGWGSRKKTCVGEGKWGTYLENKLLYVLGVGIMKMDLAL